MMPGALSPFMSGQEMLILAKGENIVICMNAEENEVRDVLAAAQSAGQAGGQAAALLDRLPAQRNFVIVGSYARLLGGMLGMPAPEGDLSPGLAVSMSFGKDYVGSDVICTIEEIIRFKNIGMGMAAMMSGRGGGAPAPAE